MTQEQTNAVMGNASENAQSIVTGANGAAVAIDELEASSKAAAIGMQILSTAGNMLISFAVSWAISALIKGINDLAHAEENARKQSAELTDEYVSETESLDDSIAKYKELSTELKNSSLSVNEVKSIKEQLLSVQDDLNNKYGAEATQLDLVNGKYDEQIKKLDELSKKNAEDYVAKNAENIDKDEKYVSEKFNVNQSLGFKGYQNKPDDYSNSGFDFKKYLDKYNALDAKVVETDTQYGMHGTVNLVTSGTRQEVYDQIESLINDLNNDFGDSNPAVTSLKKTLSSILNDSFDIDEINQSQEKVVTYGQANIIANDQAADSYRNLINAVTAYKTALTNGQGVDTARTNLINAKKSAETSTKNITDAGYALQDVYNQLSDVAPIDLKVKIGVEGASDEQKFYEDTINKFDDPQKMRTFFVENGINTKSEVEGFTSLAGATTNATEAIQAYQKAIQQNQTDFQDPTAKKIAKATKQVQKALKDYTEAQGAYYAGGNAAKKAGADDSMSRVADDAKKASDKLDAANAKLEKIKSNAFTKIWNNAGSGSSEADQAIAKEKENLLELAKAGRLTEDTFEKSSVAEKFTDIGLSIKDATTYLNKFVTKSDQLNGMETGIKSISEALGQKKENLKSKKTKDQGISADTLAGFDENIKGLDSWKNFEEIMGNGKSTMEECQKAANKLATEWVNDNNFLSQLNSTNKDYYISTLNNMGVSNAESVVAQVLSNKHKVLAAQKEYAKETGKDLTAQSVEEINKFAEEKGYTENLKYALYDLALQKQLTNGTKLSFDDDINSIIDLVESAGTATGALQALASSKYAFEKGQSNGLPQEVVQAQMEQAQKEVDAAKKKLRKKANTNVKTNVKVTPTTSSKSSKDKSKKDKSSSKQTIDWIERALSRISSTLDLVKAKAENLFGTSSLKTLQKQEASLKSQYNILKKQYDYQNKAEKKYLAKANSIKLSSSLKKAVQEGRISGSLKQLIATYGEKTATKIQNYQDYWDKAQDQKKDKEETKKSMRENISDRYQLHIDDADARKSRNEAELENLTIAKAKEKVLKDTKTHIATSYNYQIKQAQLEKDDVKVAELKAQKVKELRETEIQILQNYADEYEASVTLLENQSSSTTNVSKKNSLLQQSLTPLKQQYDKLIAIAAKEGDVTEKKRLQVEYQTKLNAKLKEQFDNVADGYEFTQTQYQQRTDSINNRISLSEAQGRYVGEAFYTNLMNNQKNSQVSIVAERDALIAARADKLKNGLSIDSSEYREMTKKIWELDRSIEQGETDIANSAKQIREAKYAIDEFKQSRIDERNNEAEFYKTILEYKDAFDDNGVITSEGLGILTSDVFEIQNNLSKVEEYKKSLADLDAQYKRGDIGYDEFITKNQSLTESMRDAQSQVYSLKDAIKSLIEDGLNAQLDALNELIDKYKKTLDTAKDLRDYNKTVTEQTKNIATIQKQLAALNGDTSEEGRAKIQKFQVSLEDAKQQLEDTEYDKRISDIENIFDDLAEDYQDFIDDQMDHVDELVDKIISAITVNSGISGEKILELSKLFGFELSDSLKNFIEHSNNTTDSDTGDEANNKIKEDVESSKLQSQDYDKQSKKESDSVSGATHKNTSTTNKTPSPGTLQQKTAISGGKIQQWHQPSYSDIGHKATLEKGATYYDYALAGGIKKGDKGKTTKSSHSVTIKNVDNNGNVQIKSKNKNLNGAWIPRKKLTYLQGFSQGGRVGDLQNIIRMNGDDGITINTLKKGEEVLTPYNADLFDKFVDFLPDLVDYNNNLVDMVRPVNVPLGNIKTGDLTLNIDNIELPNVTDPKEFSEGLITAMQQDKNLQRFWGDATAGSLKNNMSSIYKY